MCERNGDEGNVKVYLVYIAPLHGLHSASTKF